MILIYPEKQGTPTASSANPAYPASNLTDNVRQKPWMAAAGVADAVLRCPNAESAICTITLDSAEKAVRSSPAVDVGGGLVKLPVTDHLMVAGQVALVYGSTNYDGVHPLPSQAAGDAINLIITATYVAETFAGTETVAVVVETETHLKRPP
jgi:hypothetical protein